MSNLKTARQVLVSELEYAKRGLAFYESRVGSLQAALQQLDAVEGTGKTASKRAKAPRAGKAAMRDASALPKTGGDFWFKVVSKKPQSAANIANAAAASLKLDPEKDKELVHILKQRVAPMLNALVSAKKIQDSGAGRDRRFFKA